MTTTNVIIPEELMPQVNTIVKEFGFQNREEFVQEAIRDKVLELQKKIFFENTNKIAANLRKKKISENELLKNFDKVSHQKNSIIYSYKHYTHQNTCP